MRTGPLFLAAGLTAYGLLLAEDAPGTAVVLWAVLLLVAGAGIGCAFPHLPVATMSSGADEAEGSKATAAVSTTRLIAFTLTSAVAAPCSRRAARTRSSQPAGSSSESPGSPSWVS
ncbi:hypothetical protein [Streptomyces sp. SID8352]|uniref:hypothetical protein n=1 Tax=Streptomyces sp. SID8352 TaxID=2690338 RepID=UPI001368B15C|nr:hypothetical protein [Streptomyces sp. SID8352]MYU22575.1 hypothetical protein [Streptomyces sp. SID8352]